MFYSPTPSRLLQRFPFLESLTLKGFPPDFPLDLGKIDINPLIQEICLSLSCIKEVYLRHVDVLDSHLELLARTHDKHLKVLKINFCNGFSADGLMHIGKYCHGLRTLSLQGSLIFYDDTKWLLELALNSTCNESFSFCDTYLKFDVIDLMLLAKNCSQSLVCLKIPKWELVGLQDVFRYAVRLKDFDGGEFTYEEEDVGFKFPLSLECIALYNLNKTFFPFLLPIAYQLTELNLLHVSHLYRNNYYLLIRMCPNLEILYTHDVFDDKGMKLIGQSCKKMRKLRTGDEEIAPNRLTQKGIIALAQGCLELETLHINVIDITNEAMECLGAHLKNLCDFHMILLKKDTETILPLDNGVRTMLIGCRKLEKLGIYLRPGGLTDTGLGYIGKFGHNLRYLSLGYAGESDAGLMELTKGCPKLRKLETKGCAFSEQALTTFVFNIYSLRYMWVLGYPNDACAMTRPISK